MANLLLIPTQPEWTVLQPLLIDAARSGDWSIELCGFGPIAAAARTSLLIARDRPRRVLLTGIAGAYAPRLAIGAAAVFDHVACYGVGAGAGDQHQTAGDLGWPHWQGAASSSVIGDMIALDPGGEPGLPDGGLLLTCCSAAAAAEDVQRRMRKYPRATAEDMEGFGVALACGLAGVPLQIARGISNQAGDRNQANWQVSAALRAVAELALTIIAKE